jgi:WD40 repeat protein
MTDGHRFLLTFFDLIQTSVAQIYHSALPFAPKTPLWDIYYGRELHADARVTQGRETHWTSLARTVSLPSSGFTARYSHDGRMLAVGGRDFSQLFWSGTGERLAELESSCGDVESVSFSCDDRVLATSSGSTIRLWDVASGSLITTLVGDDADIFSIDFHPSIGHLLAAGDKDSRVYMWDVRDSSRNDFIVEGSTGILCWIRQRKQKRIIVSCKDGRMEMWDVNTLRRVQVFSSSQSDRGIDTVTSSDDGSLVASGSGNGAMAIYSTHTGEVVHSFKHIDHIYSIVFSPTAPILAFASWGKACLWFYATDHIVTFTSHPDRDNVYSVAFSSNGRFVASTPGGFTLCIWETDATDPDPAPDDIHHSQDIRKVHFSNDGQLIVSAASDGTVKVWDSLTGTLYTTLQGRKEAVDDAIILPDNVHIVSRDWLDQTLMVRDWQKGETLFTDTTIARDYGKFDSLFPYTHASFPLGFVSTHAKSYNSKGPTVCCWTIDLSVSGNTRVILVASGVVNTSKPDILRITHIGSAETSNLTLILECNSGKQLLALWDGPNVVGHSPAQLQFVEENGESPLKKTRQQLVGSEAPCRWSDDKAWILDQQDRQILWFSPVNRGVRQPSLWHGHYLVIGARDGRLILVDFSDAILNNDIEF